MSKCSNILYSRQKWSVLKPGILSLFPMKCSPLSLLQGLCCVQGGLSGFQSHARLAVDGHKLLAAGFNVSMADGNLAVLLSFDQPASALFETALNAQFKGV